MLDRLFHEKCDRCDGHGEYATYYNDGNLQWFGRCDNCDGTGVVQVIEPVEGEIGDVRVVFSEEEYGGEG